ncbi:MAG: hypothetical protein D6729_16145 [Deltaproteobacteria bacterium]|nr:MAG: hypothetical protein D6729_16145 [Deltaproteobacteria bacterium]
MARSDSPVVVRLRLPFEDLRHFVRKYTKYVEKNRLYLPSKKPLPVGTAVRFELLTRGGERLMIGEGQVATREGPDGKPGYFVTVRKLDPASKLVFDRLRGRDPTAEKKKPATGKRRPTGERRAPASTPSDEEATATEVIGGAGRKDAFGREAPPAYEEERSEPTELASDSGLTAASELGELPWDESREPSDARIVADPPAEAAEERHQTLVGVFSGKVQDTASPIVGIDLGTCRSLAAVAEEGTARVIPLEEGVQGIPSVVGRGPHGELLVGLSAVRKRLEQPAETIFGSKRLLGRKYHSPVARKLRQALPYEVVPDASGLCAVEVGDQRHTVTEIAARILGAVKAGVEMQLGHEVTRAVVSVPAYFGDFQRAAVREAGLLAGLEVVRIVGEPTAAALAYGFGRGLAAKRLVVYDLGGGTFDVSVLTVAGDSFEVVATGGDDFLGGMDFDLRIVQRLLLTVADRGGPAKPDPKMLERLLAAAEKAKIALTEEAVHEVRLSNLWKDPTGVPQHLEVEITRKDLESWTQDLVDRTLDLTREVLASKDLSPDLIDDVVLVGGQSRMPLVRQGLEALFGKPPRTEVDPEQAVALGCALLAEALRDPEPKTPSVQLRDVLSLAIGVGLPDGRLLPVIEANTPIPCERTLQVSTSEDGQASIEVVVFQGNVRYTDDAEYLGTIDFVGLPERPAGEVTLLLRFTLDAEGLLLVQATDEATGQSVERVLSTADSPEEVRAKLGRVNTVIHDLAAMTGEKEEGGFLQGLRRRIFGGS